MYTSLFFSAYAKEPEGEATDFGVLVVGAAVGMQAFPGSILGAYSVFSFFFSNELCFF